jgi:orotidine-5'-phosphate decarboxylase
MSAARDRLAFPLDYATLDEARRGAALVAESVGVLKVGLELFVREGAPAARIGRDFGANVFLDLKLHDIPETVERAVASAAGFGVRYLTLHASGGPKMLERAALRAEKEDPNLVLLAVTVLTSLDSADLEAIGIPADPASQALRLARLALAAGVRGFVCSAGEVATLRRELGPETTLVTPGIRPAGGEVGDQKRVATPDAAIRAGSSLLVVGRPIRDDPDPGAAARRIVDEIARAERATSATA